MTRQYTLYVGLALYALLMSSLLVTNVRAGNPTRAVFLVLLSSPLLLAILAMTLETPARIVEVTNLKTGAWSFLIGDTFVLTSAVAFAAIAWRTIPREGWYVSWWWTALSAFIGLMAGWAFHRFDGMGYVKDGAANRLLSPTKLAHDFVAYPVLFGALVCIGIPLLLHWSGYTWLTIGCVVVWGILAACDAVRGPSPFTLHPGWDEVNFRVIPDESLK